MKKYTNIRKLSDNRFLNLFHLDALTDSGRPFDYYFVSRRKADQIKLLTKDSAAEGVVIFQCGGRTRRRSCCSGSIDIL